MRDQLLGNPALCALIADTYEPMRRPQRTPARPRPNPAYDADQRHHDKKVTAALKAPGTKPAESKAPGLIAGTIYQVQFAVPQLKEPRVRFARWCGTYWNAYA